MLIVTGLLETLNAFMQTVKEDREASKNSSKEHVSPQPTASSLGSLSTWPMFNFLTSSPPANNAPATTPPPPSNYQYVSPQAHGSGSSNGSGGVIRTVVTEYKQ